jgi:glycosyltransferase involved in cell wall biosynthesis
VSTVRRIDIIFPMASDTIDSVCVNGPGNTPASAGSRPLVSFAIPVRNGERFLERALESLLAQDLDDFEVVVCDNASTDGTAEIVRGFVRCDARIRYIRNEENIGQIANFNRVFELSRGEFFRWMGADDWLEPEYASKCVAALRARPDAIGVTTQWCLVDDQHNIHALDVPGPRVDAPTAAQRLCKVLSIFQSRKQILFDPIYSLIRREALLETEMLSISRWTDLLLAFELCIQGSFCHVDEMLSTRRKSPDPRKVRLPRYHQRLKKSKKGHRWMLYAAYGKIVRRTSLTAAQKFHCWNLIFIFWLRDEGKRRWRRMKRSIKRKADNP